MELFKNCLELTSVENGHLLRYVSEIDPVKEVSKGGYFVGRVDVPFQGEQLLMTIDIVPPKDLVEKITKAFPLHSSEAVMALGMTHPNLLHHFRFENHSKNRAYSKEPQIFNHSWKLEYIIDQDLKIRIRNKECSLDADRPDVPTDSERDDAIVGTLQRDEKGFFFSLTDNEGNNKFCLMPLKAKQNADPEKEPTIKGVLSDRLSNETKQVRDIIKHFYTNGKKEKNATNISIFRLRVQFRTEGGSFLAERISGEIKDTRSTKTGAMDIFGVTNKKSCYSGGRKITITSWWDLDKESVKPRLQVYDANDKLIEDMTEELLNQPSEIVTTQRNIDFLSPSQNADKIEKIFYEMVGTEMRSTGNTIKLLLKRTGSDELESEKKVVFHYIPCHNNCDYCVRDVDGEAGSVKLEKVERKAYPGKQLRKKSSDNRDAKKPRIEVNSELSNNISPSPSQNKNNQPMEGCDRKISTGSSSGVGAASRHWAYDNNSASTSSKIIPTGQFDNNIYQPIPTFQDMTLAVPSERIENSSPGSDFEEDLVAAVTAPFNTNEFFDSLPGPSHREDVPAPVNVSTWSSDYRSSNNVMDDLTREELSSWIGRTDPTFKSDGFRKPNRACLKEIEIIMKKEDVKDTLTREMLDDESSTILRKFKMDGIKRVIKEEDEEITEEEIKETCSEDIEEDSNDRHNVSLLAHWLKLCSIKMN